MNTCGACTNWRLEGPLAKHEYGHCAVRPNPAMRAGLATSAQATCRIGRFEAKKQVAGAIPAETVEKEPAA